MGEFLVRKQDSPYIDFRLVEAPELRDPQIDYSDEEVVHILTAPTSELPLKPSAENTTGLVKTVLSSIRKTFYTPLFK